MKIFNHPENPMWAFSDAYPSHGNGGWAARKWSHYSALTIHEVTALSFGMNPITSDSFWEDKNNYGTLQIGMWNSRITEIHRAVLAGEIRAINPSTEITKDTLVDATDVEAYFKKRPLETATSPESTEQNHSTNPEIKPCDAKKSTTGEKETAAERNQRLLNRAANIYMENPSLQLCDIHKMLEKEEIGASNIQLSSLKQAVKLGQIQKNIDDILNFCITLIRNDKKSITKIHTAIATHHQYGTWTEKSAIKSFITDDRIDKKRSKSCISSKVNS